MAPAFVPALRAPAGQTLPVHDFSPERLWYRLRVAAGVSLLLHTLLVVSGGALSGSPRFAGTTQRESDRPPALLKARLATLKPPSLPPAPLPLPAAPAPAVLADETPTPKPASVATPAEDEAYGLLPAEIPPAEIPQEPVYFRASELDVRALPMASIQPLPDVAPRTRATIRLEVYISAAGTVDKVEVLSVVPDDFPTDFAVRAFKELRFDPAKMGGSQVASKKTIELTYAPE